jgi:hypothetical protein
MEPRAADTGSSEAGPDFTSQPGRCDVKCSKERAYEDERRELFQPSRQQVGDARSWLVRVIARRAVEILKAQETGP